MARFLLPYEFSPLVALLCSASLVTYLFGLRRHGQEGSRWRAGAFAAGVVLVYGVLQTRFDQWSQHMFFVHRTQHLVLHHVGPFLIALSAPLPTLLAGVPRSVGRRVVEPVRRCRALRTAYRAIQQPYVSAILFVALIYLWLIPSVHFWSMLNVPLYDAMNWGMAVDGLLFWQLMLARPGPQASNAPSDVMRISLLAAVAMPQLLIGGYIALCGVLHHDLYPVYSVCGRLWPIAPPTDLLVGGLVTALPPAMMSVAGIVVIARRAVSTGGASAAPPERPADDRTRRRRMPPRSAYWA